jgi:putative hydrolase of the HAD superfamily
MSVPENGHAAGGEAHENGHVTGGRVQAGARADVGEQVQAGGQVHAGGRADVRGRVHGNGQRPGRPVPRGLITDWGGVLTVPVAVAVVAWLEADRIELEGYRTVMREWLEAYGADGRMNPVHALERGETEPEEFERLLAARLIRVDGTAVSAAGMLTRMFSQMAPVEPMYELLRSLRNGGVLTGLLSNSWGNDYPRDLFTGVFDSVVISSEVGMRKPEERIFRHALADLGLAPDQCVFIDDIEANVEAARALGMVGLHHRDPGATAAAVKEIFGLS